MTKPYDEALAKVGEAQKAASAGVDKAFSDADTTAAALRKTLTTDLDRHEATLSAKVGEAVASLKPVDPAIRWKMRRGINLALPADRCKTLGINLIRTKPKVTWDANLNPTIDWASFDPKLEAWRKAGVGVVIDPHTFPGFARGDTTFADDAFWTDLKFRRAAVKYWLLVATHLADAGEVIAGYDPLNEPTQPCKPDGSLYPTTEPQSWRGYIEDVRDAIRSVDTVHTILVPLANRGGAGLGPWKAGNTDLENAFVLDDPLGNQNTCAEFHYYSPQGYVINGDGTAEYAPDGSYAGIRVGKDLWNRQRIVDTVKPIIAWAKKAGVPLCVLEFAPVPTKGQASKDMIDGGAQYLADEISVWEENGIAWGFHTVSENAGSFDGAKNPEMFTVLKNGWKLNS